MIPTGHLTQKMIRTNNFPVVKQAFKLRLVDYSKSKKTLRKEQNKAQLKGLSVTMRHLTLIK